MVLYGINLAPLAEELRAADQGLLSLFYADDVEFDGSVQRSAQLLKLLMKCGLCDTAGRQGRGLRSIAIGIGRNFSSASRGSRQLQS